MTVETSAPWVPTDTFATRLILVRGELDMTVKQAAEKTGLHYATWSTWENGRTPADMAAVVRAIADGLGVSREWLMWGGPLKNAPKPDGPEGVPVGLPRLDSNQQPAGYRPPQVIGTSGPRRVARAA